MSVLTNQLANIGRASVLVCRRCSAAARKRFVTPFKSVSGACEPDLLDIQPSQIWSREHDSFRKKAHHFFCEEVASQKDRWEKQCHVDHEIWLRAGELGFLGIATPAEVGGHAGDYLTAAILWEEQWASNCRVPDFTLHNDVVIPYIVEYGTQQQKDEYLPGMLSGNCIGAIAINESSSQSDLHHIKTSARRDGEDWILNGSKVFISHGHIADLIVVAAITKPDAKSPAHGMSLFLLDSSTPGFTRGKRVREHSFTAEATSHLFLEDVRLPSNKLLGVENSGFSHIMNLVPTEKLILSSRTHTSSEMIFNSTKNTLRKCINDFQTVKDTLLDVKTRICTTRYLYHKHLLIHNDRGLTKEESDTLEFITRANYDYVTTECLQLSGCLTFEYPIPGELPKHSVCLFKTRYS